MIIQINATVCAAVDHGDDRQHKIAGSGRCLRGKERTKKGLTGETRNSMSAAEMLVLAGHNGDQASGTTVAVRAPGRVGDSGPMCVDHRLRCHQGMSFLQAARRPARPNFPPLWIECGAGLRKRAVV